jgi:cytochrome c553
MRRLLFLILICAPLPALAQAGAAIAPDRIASCEGCHGGNGQTRSPETPRLNGQTREYLEARLKDLRNPNNQTLSAIHNMRGPVRSIRLEEIPALAAHFAAQAPTPAKGGEGGYEAGARLFRDGAGEKVAGCAGCHGAQGEGRDAAPRLAGQHGAYLRNQLEAYQISARVQATMNKHSWALTPDQMQALVSFLASD